MISETCIKPNFFILGAPKCGTTAISEYLRDHPSIFMSDPKELHFFSRDIRSSPYAKTLDDYLNFFSNAGDRHQIRGEASAEYLMSSCASKEISERFPNAKILVMLRNPAELVYSFYSQLVKHGEETILDFEKAWGLQETRRLNLKLPRFCTVPGLLQYAQVGRLGSQVVSLREHFRDDQIHYILFDDLQSNIQQVYDDLLQFLEVRHDGRKTFPRCNEALQYKSVKLGQYPKLLRARFSGPLSIMRNRFGFKGSGVLRLIDLFNVKSQANPKMTEHTRDMLNSFYRDEVDLLSRCLGRDLSAWH